MRPSNMDIADDQRLSRAASLYCANAQPAPREPTNGDSHSSHNYKMFKELLIASQPATASVTVNNKGLSGAMIGARAQLICPPHHISLMPICRTLLPFTPGSPPKIRSQG